MPKVDLRNKVGVIVHAILKNILGNHTMKKVYGNVNHTKTFIQGTIMIVFNRPIPGGKNEQHDNQHNKQQTTNITTDMELEQEQLNPQLAEHVVGEVCGIHHQDIAEQAPEVMLGFPPRCSSANSAATAFVVLEHSHQPCKKSTINHQKAKK
jgi:hypothetical protein